MPCQIAHPSYPRPAPVAGRRALSTRIAGLIRKHWRAYWDRRARKATIMLLRSLDRRTLHDIGISPSEIESLCLGDCDDRRPRYDAGWMWRRGER